MEREKLIAKGVPESQIDSVLNLFSEEIKNKYVPLYRFNEINDELKGTKTEIENRNSQIEELKKFEGDNQSLKEKLEEMGKINVEETEKLKSSFEKEKVKNLVKVALLSTEKKPHDIDLVSSLINLEQIKINEKGEVEGLEKQIEELNNTKQFLFAQDTKGKADEGWKPYNTAPNEGKSGEEAKDSLAEYGSRLAKVSLEMKGITSKE